MIDHKAKLHAAMLEISKQEEILQGAIKLYGALSDPAASSYHAMAHSALDAIMDATRAKHFHLALMIKEGGA